MYEGTTPPRPSPLWAGSASQQRPSKQIAQTAPEDTDFLYGAPLRRATGAAPSILARSARPVASGKPPAVATASIISTPSRTRCHFVHPDPH